jgi:uncharacterized repeat protein (TIGR03803 family)
MKNRTVILFAVILLLTTAAWAGNQAVLYTFCTQPVCTDGAYPYAGLVYDGVSNFYGTTQDGGPDLNGGTIYQLTHTSSGWTHTVIYAFTGGSDGSNPVGPLVFDQAGNLYGVASTGGRGFGTVFELTPSNGSWTFQVIYTFQGGNDGLVGIDSGGLAVDAHGNLYGTTEMGGTAGFGTVFELTPSNGSWTKATLYSFAGGNDAADPLAGVTLDPAGNIYGATVGGGAFGGGAVFELTQSQGSWTESVIYSFTGGDDGAYPEFGALIIDSAGNLYGTAAGGGAFNQGVVYEMSPAGGGNWNQSVLYTFTGGNDGGQPFAGLTFGQTGNLFGAAAYFGANGDGTIFELVKQAGGWDEKTVYTFGSSDGKYPYGAVVFDQYGNMFGTTFWGGNLNCNNPPQGCGIAFEIVPANTLQQFPGSSLTRNEMPSPARKRFE